MRRTVVQLLEDDIDESSVPTAWELGIPVDLVREDLEDEDDLGLRSLFEHPEAVLGSPEPLDAA
jgi:hypothetical protein